MSMLKEHEKAEVRSDRTRLRIFDCDVHPVPKARTDEPGGLFAEGLAGTLRPQGGNA